VGIRNPTGCSFTAPRMNSKSRAQSCTIDKKNNGEVKFLLQETF
jgi:hypothetical protein